MYLASLVVHAPQRDAVVLREPEQGGRGSGEGTAVLRQVCGDGGPAEERRSIVARHFDEFAIADAEPSRRARRDAQRQPGDRKSTRLNSSHSQISYAVFCLKQKNHIPFGNDYLPFFLVSFLAFMC